MKPDPDNTRAWLAVAAVAFLIGLTALYLATAP